jgi:hypothetical protein
MTPFMDIFIAALVAGLAWFLVAGILFFNPVVDRIYRLREGHPAVRALPTGPRTVGKIMAAIMLQTLPWAWLFAWLEPALPREPVAQGLAFGALLCAVKLVGRDVDRVLLSTYPAARLAIELVIGIVCAGVVGVVFAFML